MKVLHIGKYCPPFFGGIENFMMDLASECVDQGAQVAAICHHHLSGQVFDRREIDGVTVYRVPTYGRVMFAPVCPAFGYYLNRVIDEFKPQILHIHMPNTSAFFALLSRKARQLNWVVHWHSDVLGDNSPWFLKTFYPFYQPFENAMVKRASVVIATSPPYLQISPVLQRYKDKCQVIPLGLKPLPPLEKTQKRQGLNLLMIGRLTYYKGHRYLIEALSLLKQRGINQCHLTIVGTGEQETDIANQIASLDLSAQVSLLGQLPYDQLLQQLCSADCLVLPSIERTEAFGVVLMEAASYGVPAIVSNVPGSGMSWVIQHDQNGLVVKRCDAESLAEAITQLIETPERLARYSVCAQKRFNDCFKIDRVATQTLTMYVNSAS